MNLASYSFKPQIYSFGFSRSNILRIKHRRQNFMNILFVFATRLVEVIGYINKFTTEKRKQDENQNSTIAVLIVYTHTSNGSINSTPGLVPFRAWSMHLIMDSPCGKAKPPHSEKSSFQSIVIYFAINIIKEQSQREWKAQLPSKRVTKSKILLDPKQ